MLEQSIQKTIKKDHENIRNLLKELEKAIKNEDANRDAIFDQLAKEVIAHSKAEEDVLYEALIKENKEKMNEKVAEGKEEHHLAEILIQEMKALNSKDSQWEAKFEVLKENLKHHLTEEERDILPQSKGMIDKKEATQLSEEFQDEKETKRVEGF